MKRENVTWGLLLLAFCALLGLAGCRLGRMGSQGELPRRLEVLQTTPVFTDPGYYAAFPGWVRTSDTLAMQFSIQELAALRATKLHPHYFPVGQDRWALSRDSGAQWTLTARPPELGVMLHATRHMHSAAAAMADGALLSYEARYGGSTTATLRRLRIDRDTPAGQPAWYRFAAGYTRLMDFYPYDLEALPRGGFLLSGYWSRDPKGKEVSVFRGSAGGQAWRHQASLNSPDPLFVFSESDMVAWEDGRVVIQLRADHDPNQKSKWPAEVNGNGMKRDGYGYYLYQSESADFGQTWSAPRQLPIWGHPPNLLKLQSGNLLLVYGHRRPPFEVHAVLSHDRGQTWDLASTVALNTASQGNYDFGYPVATQTPDGRIHVAWYGYSTSDLSETSPHGIYYTTLQER